MKFCIPLVLITAVLFLVGCSARPDNIERENSTLKPLVIAYGQFIASHRGTPPANEAEFREHLNATWDSIKEFHQVKSVDELFISNRDKKPYVVLYGIVNGPPGPGGQPVIAYEQVGVSGKRFIASSLGAIEEVDEAKFKQMVPSATPVDPTGS